jgi:hypothetical protein
MGADITEDKVEARSTVMRPESIDDFDAYLRSYVGSQVTHSWHKIMAKTRIPRR